MAGEPAYETLEKTTMTCTPTMPLREGVAGQGVLRVSAKLTLTLTITKTGKPRPWG